MTKNMMMDAISCLDIKLLETYVRLDRQYLTQRNHKKRPTWIQLTTVAASICLMLSAVYVSSDLMSDPTPIISEQTQSTAKTQITDPTITPQVSETTPLISDVDKGISNDHTISMEQNLGAKGEKITLEEIYETLQKEYDFITVIFDDMIAEGILAQDDQYYLVNHAISQVTVNQSQNNEALNYAVLPVINSGGDLVARVELLKTSTGIIYNVSCESREERLNDLLKEYPNQDIVIVGVLDGLASVFAITPDGKLHLLGGKLPKYDENQSYYHYFNVGSNVINSNMLTGGYWMYGTYVETEGYQ